MEENSTYSFNDELWDLWCLQESQNYILRPNADGSFTPDYLKKGYKHFDYRFWFPERKDELKEIIKNGLRIGENHKQHWWAFSPFIKILIKAPRYKYQQDEDCYALDTKIRPICFASHIDSLIFGYYSFLLTKKYEEYLKDKDFDNSSVAYRSNLDGKCNIQFAKEVFDEIKKRKSCTAIALDIKGYFNNIDHQTLKQKWRKVLGTNIPDDQHKIFKALTNYTYVNKDSILRKYNGDRAKLHFATYTELVPGKDNYEKFDRLRKDNLLVKNEDKNDADRPIGIPQGSALSATLSNIYLIDYDSQLSTKAREEDFFYRRYCDDIIIVCDSLQAESLKKFAIDLITNPEHYLTIQDKKVEVIEFKQNSKGVIRAFNKSKLIQEGCDSTTAENGKFYYKSLQYLGFEFNGKDVFIRGSSLSRYYKLMHAKVVKTVAMAYSGKMKKNNLSSIGSKKLIEKYTHLGKRNFIKYALNASKKIYNNSKGIEKEGMDSPAIRKQISHHTDVLHSTLKEKNIQRFLWKSGKGKNVKFKDI